MLEFFAQRPTDLSDAQCARRALVQQWLEDVTRRPVQQRHIGLDAPESASAEKAAEPATDDDHLGA
jgi:hypothetical protein